MVRVGVAVDSEFRGDADAGEDRGEGYFSSYQGVGVASGGVVRDGEDVENAGGVELGCDDAGDLFVLHLLLYDFIGLGDINMGNGWVEAVAVDERGVYRDFSGFVFFGRSNGGLAWV